MADLTFRWNRKAMMLHGSGESSIPAHAKRGTIHGVAGSRDLRNAVLAARLQRGPSEPALEQLELLKRQDLRNRDCRRRRGFAEEGEVSVKVAAVNLKAI